MVIVLDLDDILANLRESLYQAMLDATGHDKHWRDWRHYDLARHYGIDNAAVETILLRARALETCQPEPDAATTTHALRALGYEVVIVTARAWHPQATDLTRAWLKQHGMHYDHLAVTALGGNKLDALAQFSTIALAVDDHPHNVRHYEQRGIYTLMLDRPWNRHYSAINRIHSLESVVYQARSRALGL